MASVPQNTVCKDGTLAACSLHCTTGHQLETMHATFDTTLSLTQVHFFSLQHTYHWIQLCHSWLHSSGDGLLQREQRSFLDSHVARAYQHNLHSKHLLSVLMYSHHVAAAAPILARQTASDHPFVSIYAVCLEDGSAALSIHGLQHQSSPAFSSLLCDATSA